MTDFARNCISHWHPLLEAAGVPTPRTILCRIEPHITPETAAWLLGEGRMTDQVLQLRRDIAGACDQISVAGPWFLRSGHFSGKHAWSSTCYLNKCSPGHIESHVRAIVEEGECASMIGFPWNVWAVREFIPMHALDCAGQAHEFGGMPVRREYRAFVNGGKVLCVHPSWPADAFTTSRSPQFDAEVARISSVLDFNAPVIALAEKAGAALGGEWSVDILRDENGTWLVTDCAVAADSFHWPSCPRLAREAVPA